MLQSPGAYQEGSVTCQCRASQHRVVDVLAMCPAMCPVRLARPEYQSVYMVKYIPGLVAIVPLVAAADDGDIARGAGPDKSINPVQPAH